MRAKNMLDDDDVNFNFAAFVCLAGSLELPSPWPQPASVGEVRGQLGERPFGIIFSPRYASGTSDVVGGSGLVLVSVEHGSLAARLGLQPGMTLLELRGMDARRVQSKDLSAALCQLLLPIYVVFSPPLLHDIEVVVQERDSGGLFSLGLSREGSASPLDVSFVTGMVMKHSETHRLPPS